MENDADVAAAARTLERMRAYVNAAVPQQQRAAIFHEMARLPVERLARMNPAEAEHEMDRLVYERQTEARVSTQTTVVCASRGSALALAQARTVASLLARHGIASTMLTVTTTGDRDADRSPAAIGSQSIFVKELELALRDGRADYAVHSAKDLPSTLPSDMRVVAVSTREDARDAFCSERYAGLRSLPPGARVGTSSPRRRAQLLRLRGDLRYEDIRGNIDTRLRKLRDGAYDAIVLACAGLARLHVRATHTVPFEIDEIVPAASQGALAVETRAGSDTLAQALRLAVNDDRAELAVLCERAALRALQGGCQAPIGIHARFDGAHLAARGIVASLDGGPPICAQLDAPVSEPAHAEALGAQLGETLLVNGARLR